MDNLNYNMLKNIGFNYYDEGSGMDDLCIFRYNITYNKDDKPQHTLLINYKEYDHHNDPRMIAVVVKEGNEWVVKERVTSWRTTKYSSKESQEMELRYDELYDEL